MYSHPSVALKVEMRSVEERLGLPHQHSSADYRTWTVASEQSVAKLSKKIAHLVKEQTIRFKRIGMGNIEAQKA